MTPLDSSAPPRMNVRLRPRPSFTHRFSQHRGGVAGAVVVACFIAAATVGPFLTPYDPLGPDLPAKLQAPSAAHWLGTDELGRDLLSRLIHGAAISMRAGLAVVLLAMLIGVPIGALSGYFGGLFDLLVQRLIDVILAFPGILLLILIVALIGPSLEFSVLGLGVLSVPVYARLIRGNVLQVKQFAYVEAARAVGCTGRRVLLRHVLPNSMTPVIVQSSLQAATALVLLAGISFLGLGAQPPTPEWGAMLATGKVYMRASPHLVLFPGMAISLVVLGLNLVGDALRDALDPRAAYGSH